HLNYQGDAISVGIGIGANTSNPNGKAKPALQGLGYGTITPTHKTSTTHSAITDQAGLSHINTENFNQPEVQDELNQIIANDFDKERVLTELGAQTSITQAFDAERRAIRSEFAKKAGGYRKQAEKLSDDDPRKEEFVQQAQDIEQKLRIFDGITSALYAPNSNGIIGDVSRTVSPELAYRIGQAFKNNELKNQTDNGSRPEEQSLQHLLAHAVLGAAVSYSTGNDITTGTISAVSNEAGAKVLANYLYQGKDPKDLTQEQKDTIVSILNLATATAIYTATDDSTTDAVGGAEIGKVGVENNNDARFYGHPSDRIQISNEEALVIKEAFSIALPVLDSLELANAYKNAKTDAEKQAVLASALQIPVNKAGKVLKAVKSGKKANIQKEVKAVQAEQRNATQTKATCTNGTVCFTAGTLIETSEGLKAIETFTGGELIWTRNDITLEYGYRPVVATKATPNQPIFQVTVKNHQGDIETLQTTAEHPFWIKDTGWLKASLLEQGMILLDRNNQEVEVISQFVLPNHTDTVYNIEVDDFHTYHVGRLGVWVHNADCCGVALSTLESHVEKSARGTGKLHNITEPELKQLILGIGYNKDELLKAKAILEHSIKVRKAEKPKFGGRLDKRHNDRIKMEQGILDKVNSMLKELE
ncbi:polymorphic toxin-type HINT domain-containing protein, partial [Moraxella sp. Tifton1]|uniref:polymorphic toxin-type HINT domain-containing protein n=1 Tax=Moraxella oculi TaxID=2940516 RepID=UPI0020124D6F